MSDFNPINQAVSVYVQDKTPKNLNLAMIHIQEYVKAEATLFLKKNTTDVEKDDLIQNALLMVLEALMKYYTPDNRPFSYLMTTIVKRVFKKSCGKELKYTTMTDKVKGLVDKHQTKRGRKL